MWCDGLKLCQGKFRFGIRKNFFLGSGEELEQAAMTKVQSLTLEVHKERVNVVLRGMV